MVKDFDIEKMKEQLKTKKHELPNDISKEQLCVWLAEKRIETRKERQSKVEVKF